MGLGPGCQLRTYSVDVRFGAVTLPDGPVRVRKLLFTCPQQPKIRCDVQPRLARRHCLPGDVHNLGDDLLALLPNLLGQRANLAHDRGVVDLANAHGGIFVVRLLAYWVPLRERELVGRPRLVGVIPGAVMERHKDVPRRDIADTRGRAHATTPRLDLHHVAWRDAVIGCVVVR